MIPELTSEAQETLADIQRPLLGTIYRDLNEEDMHRTDEDNKEGDSRYYFSKSQYYAEEIVQEVEKLQHAIIQSNGNFVQWFLSTKAEWATHFRILQENLVGVWKELKPLLLANVDSYVDGTAEKLGNVYKLMGFRGMLGELQKFRSEMKDAAVKGEVEDVYRYLTGASHEEYRRKIMANPFNEELWVERNGPQYIPTKIGCNEFLTVFANVDAIKQPIPSKIVVNGIQVPVRVLRADGFLVLRAKLTLILESAKLGKYALGHKWTESSFLLVICTETPFNIAGYKFINSPPQDPWDISGGLENISKEKGLGQRMIQGCLSIAKAYKIRQVIIDTVEDSYGFYLKMGFQGLPGKVMTYMIP